MGRKYALNVIVVVALGILLCLAGLSNWSSTDLTLAVPADVDLGELFENSSHEFVVPIRNDTSQSIDVVSISSTCKCSVIDKTHFSLSPGETQNTRIGLNVPVMPRTIDLRLTGKSESTATLAIRYKASGSNDERVSLVDVNWSPKRTIWFSENYADLGSNEAKEFKSREKTIEFFSDQSLARVRLEFDETVINATQRLNNGKNGTITIRGQSNLSAGEIKSELRVIGITQGGLELPPCSLWVIGELYFDVTLSPELVLVPQNSTDIVEVISLQSRTGRVFEVVEVQTSHSEIIATSIESSDQKKQQFRVEVSSDFKSNALGLGWVEFEIAEREEAPYKKRVLVRGM